MENSSLVATIIIIILFLALPFVLLAGAYIYIIFSSIREKLKSNKVTAPTVKDIPDKKENLIMVVADTVDIDAYKDKRKNDKRHK